MGNRTGRDFRAVLMMGAATLALGLLPASAYAQAAAPAADPAPGDIVVTAQKRSQNIQDVGIAMSAFSGQTLARLNVKEAADIATIVPNVQANYGAGQIVFNVRGIGTNEFSANLDSPIAINLDDVYLSKAFMTDLMLFDVDRVEVLKGPQGTLFGRNATGGAVNFFTNRPTRTFHAGMTVGIDNYDTLRSEAYVSGPLTNTLSYRVSGMINDQGRGYYDDLTLNRSEGKERKAAGRLQIAYDDGSTKGLLSGYYGHDWSQAIPYEGVGAYTPASLAAGTPQFCPEYLNGTVNGATADCVRATDGLNPGDKDPYTANNNLIHKQRNTGWGTTLHLDHDLGFANLTSISSYQWYKRDQREDGDGSPGNDVDIYYYNRIKQFTQEVRLTSPADKPFSYVVGGYYEHDNFENGDYLVAGGGLGTGYWSPFTQKVNSLAGFLNATYKLTSTLSVIGGLRYSHETIGIDGSTFYGQGLTGSPEMPTTIVGTASTSAATIDGGHKTENRATWKAGLEWRPDASAIGADNLLVYGHVSTGFRSGAYNAEFADPQVAFTSLAPEKITAYEGGFKTAFADRSIILNASVFHYDFKDGFISVDSSTSPIPITINAANIRSTGAELELSLKPIRNFTLSANGGYLHSRIASDITVGGSSLDGNRTIQSPKWNGTVQGFYETPLTQNLNLTLSANANWRSSQYFEATNVPVSREKPYWLVGLQGGIHATDDSWSMTLWVKNLTKTRYRTYVNDLSSLGWVLNIYGPPRTYGLTVGRKF